MSREYWQKQTAEAPLFSDLLWSRPENRRHAGKLLVLGGNLHGFSAPAAAYNEAEQAGVGKCRVILPDALYKTVSRLFPAAEYAASTKGPSGGFARAALAEWLSQSAWGDGVLLAGDLGRNSETAILLESYLEKYDGQLTLVNDAVEYCLDSAGGCLDRPNTTLVLNIAQLQKLGTVAKFTSAFTSGQALLQLVDLLHDFNSQHAANLIVHHDGNILVAVDGHITSTRSEDRPLTTVAAHSSVWWLQNPSQPLQALTTAVCT